MLRHMYQNIHSREPGQLQVEEKEVDRILVEDPECRFPVACLEGSVALMLENST
jgi:hypothetical protein